MFILVANEVVRYFWSLCFLENAKIRECMGYVWTWSL